MIRVFWSESAENKIRNFRSDYYTMEETRDFVTLLMYEVESLLLNPFLSKRYVEEKGKYKGISRAVLRKFRIYYKRIDGKILIMAIKYPGEK